MIKIKEDNWIMLNYKYQQWNYVYHTIKYTKVTYDKKAKNKFIYFELFAIFLKNKLYKKQINK